MIANAPCIVSNRCLHNDIEIPYVIEGYTIHVLSELRLSTIFHISIPTNICIYI